MPSSSPSSSGSASERVATPFTGSSDDGHPGGYLNSIPSENQPAHPQSSPVKSSIHPVAPVANAQFIHHAQSSPLTQRTSSDLVPGHGFSSYANLNTPFLSYRDSSKSDLKTPSSQSQAPSAQKSTPSHNDPRNPILLSSDHLQLTPARPRSYWDFTTPTNYPSSRESSPSPNMSEQSAPAESRKRFRESLGSPHDRSTKSLRTTPSPGVTAAPSPGASVNDPFDVDIWGSDPEGFFADTTSAKSQEFRAQQKAIEDDLKARKRPGSDAVRSDEEITRLLYSEIDPYNRSAETAGHSHRTASSSHGTPSSSKRSLKPYPGTTKLPLSPSTNRTSSASYLSGGLSQLSGAQKRTPGHASEFRQTPKIKAEYASDNRSVPVIKSEHAKENRAPASKRPLTVDKHGYIEIPDDSDEETETFQAGPPRTIGLGSNSRPSTATSAANSQVSLMDLTGNNSNNTSGQQASRRATGQVPGSWDSSNPALGASSTGRYSFASDALNGNSSHTGTTDFPSQAQPSYHGAGGTGVYGSVPSDQQGFFNDYGSTSGYNGYGGYANPGYGAQNPSAPYSAYDYGQGTSTSPYGIDPPGYGEWDGLGDGGYEAPGAYHSHITKEETEKELRSLLDNIQAGENLGADDRTDTPEDMAEGAALYKYQIIGLAWLTKMEEGSNKGGILADGMGLGKTIQAIALMVSRRSTDRKRKTTLIVCPVALLKQWENEIRIKVKPEHSLNVWVYHGGKTNKPWNFLRSYDVVLTTYGILGQEFRRKEAIDMAKMADPHWRPVTQRDQLPLLGDESKWYRVILDEAQNVKNKTTVAAKAVCCLTSLTKFCMTGTPMMNNITELFSLIRFLGIRPYCNWEKFRSAFDGPIKKGTADDETMRKLQTLLKAIMLRRTKQSELDGQPIITLPARTTEIDHAVFDEEQGAFYEAIEKSTQLRMNRYLAAGTVGKSYSNILEMLLRLRQACCHPHLIKNFAEQETEGDAADNPGFLKNALEHLSPEAIARLKLTESLECPVCYDAALNPRIFSPCGHFTCTECFAKVSDPTNQMNQGDGDRVRFLCHACRGEWDPKKTTDWVSFRKAHVPEPTPAEQAFGEDDGSDSDSDSDTDSDSDSDSDSGSEIDDKGNLKDFIVDDNEDAEEDVSDSDDDLDAVKNEPADNEGGFAEFERKFEEGQKHLAEMETVAARAPKSGEVPDSEDPLDDEFKEDKWAKAKAKAAEKAEAAKGKGNGKSRGKEKKKRSKKEKKAKGAKKLAELQRDGRKNAKARAKYFKRLRKDWISSAKVDRCLEILRQIEANDPQEKTIVFSLFTTFLDLVELPLLDEGFQMTRYDGSMTATARNDAVTEFTTDPRCKIMLVSLKAGNAGLNLTAANNIVLLDPFWNPYIEEQAIDRAHRIGQRREVKIHRILIKETVEDRIVALQEKKRTLIDGALDEKASKSIGRLSTQDLIFLFGLSRR